MKWHAEISVSDVHPLDF